MNPILSLSLHIKRGTMASNTQGVSSGSTSAVAPNANASKMARLSAPVGRASTDTLDSAEELENDSFWQTRAGQLTLIGTITAVLWTGIWALGKFLKNKGGG